MGIKVKFWGVRGSLATPGHDYLEFGGNTSCVEMICGDQRLIFDSGTGIRSVGDSYLKDGVDQANIYLSHTHWDHISGFPFFGPAFKPGFKTGVWAGHLLPDNTVKEVLSGQMTQPFFPVPIEIMNADMSFHDFNAGETLDGGADSDGNPIVIKTTSLNHPNDATGYRVEYKGSSACYITDVEHVVGETDSDLAAFVKGTDLFIYDSTYDDRAFTDKISWGHSTWQEGVRLSKLAGVKQYAIFHHDLSSTDDYLRDIEAQAKAEFEGAFCARELMELEV